MINLTNIVNKGEVVSYILYTFIDAGHQQAFIATKITPREATSSRVRSQDQHGLLLSNSPLLLPSLLETVIH